MHTLIYLSASSYLFSDEEIINILNTSRINNTQLDITGLLLYHEGSILQILEGKKETIHTLFNKISMDKRHKAIIKTLDTNIEKRSFPDWSMGFQEVSNQDWANLTGHLNLNNKDTIHEIAGSQSNHILSMIRSFIKVNQLHTSII